MIAEPLHVEYQRDQRLQLAHFSFFSKQNDLPNAPNILELHLFADDTNLFPNNTNILNLETNLNGELQNVSL